MPRILIIFAHPRFEKSRSNKILLTGLNPEVTFHDLYEKYPDFNIDLNYEKQLLLQHDVIIWHHPFYWYSCPPLLKQWIDIVLEYGWAYGKGGTALAGKFVFNAITSGGGREMYSKEGHNRFTLNQFLVPFEQTAALCKMVYLPPFAVQGTHKLSNNELQHYNAMYQKLITRLQIKFDTADILKHNLLNDWMTSPETTNA
jgi:glutathione-regulated potassium-efflux system ancillary protein KefG